MMCVIGTWFCTRRGMGCLYECFEGTSSHHLQNHKLWWVSSISQNYRIEPDMEKKDITKDFTTYFSEKQKSLRNW